MEDVASGLNQRIAEQVRGLRTGQGLSLDALAGRSGVSRSMISLIERGESSPTAVVLERLAAGLDVTLGAERHRLREGDCLAMQLDRPTMFHNPTRKPARYAVVIASETPWKR